MKLTEIRTHITRISWKVVCDIDLQKSLRGKAKLEFGKKLSTQNGGAAR
jgi:hypothetical protein